MSCPAGISQCVSQCGVNFPVKKASAAIPVPSLSGKPAAKATLTAKPKAAAPSKPIAKKPIDDFGDLDF